MTQQQLKEVHVIILGDLEGDLTIPLGSQALVLFAHGSGSSRYSSRNQFVANILNNKGIATLLVDLLSQEEKRKDEETKHVRFNIELLAARFAAVTSWLAQQPETKDLKIGYFGSSTGAAAALIAAARLDAAKAIVTRGGRPNLADESVLHQVKVPTLFIVGGNDKPVIAMNKRALESLSNTEVKEMAIIPCATHLFEETGKMEEVAQIAADWFECYLLRTGKKKKKLHDKYAGITRAGFLSPLWNRRAFQIKFKDRFAAGEILTSVLIRYKNDRDGITVIGIARGGVVMADVIAEKLNGDFDIIVARKLRSPHNLENAVGAIMHDGSVYLDRLSLEKQHVSDEYIDMEKLEQKKEIERKLRVYRPYGGEYKIRDRTVILVDDGIATGATMIAAARYIKKHKPKRLIVAAPVAPRQIFERLKSEVDQIETVIKSSDFKTVEQFYQEFGEVSDDQIVHIVKRRFLNS